MDFSNVIINALGLQDVQIEKIEQNKNDLSLKIVARQASRLAAVITAKAQFCMFTSGKNELSRGPHLGPFLRDYPSISTSRILSHLR
ncbi:MAG: hypothetical protein IPK04_04035 [Bdellovibrionales bacterium]|nr:hypothetical protein [Bdellovibrionales bacterium]